MSPYTHLTLKDRESIMLGISTGKTLDTIAKEIGRSKSTVSREIARNGGWRSYSAGTAQDCYRRVRLASRRPRILDRPGNRDAVIRYITVLHWSPEQIAGRLSLEGSPIRISYSTIYRGIYHNNVTMVGLFVMPSSTIFRQHTRLNAATNKTTKKISPTRRSPKDRNYPSTPFDKLPEKQEHGAIGRWLHGKD